MKTNKTRVKKLLLSFFAMLIPLLASANLVKIETFWYNLDENNNQAEVTRGSGNYSGSITIPWMVSNKGINYSVTSIGDDAFNNCTNITSINIPESVTRIGNNAFYNCTKLTSIIIPKNVTNIGNLAFGDCTSLFSVTISEGSKLTYIGDRAFTACKNLTSITIPEGVVSIGHSAFSGCENLTSFSIPQKSQLTSIGEEIFSYCANLDSINIPEGVTSVKMYTFRDCSKLTYITIPAGVTNIEHYAFSGCSSLSSIVLPQKIKSIGFEAFAGCTALLDVYCYAETIPEIYSNAFDGICLGNVTLHILASSLNAYTNNAPWSSFGNFAPFNILKCTTPTIKYINGKIELTCDTEGAVVKTKLDIENDMAYEGLEFDLIPTYTLTAYATKDQYEDSDVATLTLCWIPCDGQHMTTEVTSIPSKPVLIQSKGGTITLGGLADDTEVAAYDLVGNPLDATTATGGAATLTTNLAKGDIVIVKIGNNSIKIAIK